MRRKVPTCSEEELVPVNELRQYHFCPRVVYYRTLGIEEPLTEYMREGKKFQEELWWKEKRRRTLMGLRRLKVDEKITGLKLVSKRLCLHGTVDLVIRIGNEWIVVEVKRGKLSGKPLLGHKVQAAAYSMLVEEEFCTVTRRYFLLYDKLIEVPMTEEMRDHVVWSIKKVLEIYRGKVPEVKPSRKCKSCGYQRYCFT